MSETTIMPPEPATSARRAAANRENAQYSTGPRTEAGKQRSSMNALRHGLTAACPVLPSEDPADYEDHRRAFFDEYKPATRTEAQLVQELVDTSWRLNRIPALEADALDSAFNVPPHVHIDPATELDIIADAHRALAILGLHSSRLSRQFQKALNQLRSIQADRAEHERRELHDAASVFQLYSHKGILWQPADDGFVFSREQVEVFADRVARLEEARPFHRGPSNPWHRRTAGSRPTVPAQE